MSARFTEIENDGMRVELMLLLNKHIAADGECWRWSRIDEAAGYGYLSFRGRKYQAHRLSYLLWVGPLDSTLVLDHLCRNKWCVNPGHLEQVSSKENILRGEGQCAKNLRKAACKRGHPLSFKTDGSRICRECQNVSNLAYYHRTKRLKP